MFTTLWVPSVTTTLYETGTNASLILQEYWGYVMLILGFIIAFGIAGWLISKAGSAFHH